MRIRFYPSCVVVFLLHLATGALMAQGSSAEVHVLWYSTDLGKYLPPNAKTRILLTQDGTGIAKEVLGESTVFLSEGLYLLRANYPGFKTYHHFLTVRGKTKVELIIRTRAADTGGGGLCEGVSGIVPERFDSKLLQDSVLVADGISLSVGYALKPSIGGTFQFGPMQCGSYQLFLQRGHTILWSKMEAAVTPVSNLEVK